MHSLPKGGRCTRVLFLICVVSTGCQFYGSGDFAIKLPGRYTLVRANHIDVVIHDPDQSEFVIRQTIDAYAVRGTIVVGHVTAPMDKSREYDGMTSGYFFLNTQTGQKQVGLDKSRWLDELRRIGIQAEPALRKPSAADPQYSSDGTSATTEPSPRGD